MATTTPHVAITQYRLLWNRFNFTNCHQCRYLLGHELFPSKPALPSDIEIYNCAVSSTRAWADASYNVLRIINGNRFFSPLPPRRCVRTALDLKLNYRYVEASNNFFYDQNPGITLFYCETWGRNICRHFYNSGTYFHLFALTVWVTHLLLVKHA
jgi:hypothetical protein